ncbi:hypothetical protein RRG08_037611 [Elysia crispata]|uniref:Uncharacterized protein n=1 Tax=Elysia crispata TaxID=231223 RepID=A0AAE1CYA9_9GAST|nr:hypothetical protein RRG08_037611 [Elysia crispata]
MVYSPSSSVFTPLFTRSSYGSPKHTLAAVPQVTGVGDVEISEVNSCGLLKCMHTFSTEGFGCSRQEDGVELVRGSSGLPGLVINRGTVDGKLVTFKIRSLKSTSPLSVRWLPVAHLSTGAVPSADPDAWPLPGPQAPDLPNPTLGSYTWTSS